MTRLLIVLSTLHLALAVSTKGADTNSVPASPYKAVLIHNDSEAPIAESTSSRPATIYEIVTVPDQPSRGGLVASEREFRFGTFGVARNEGGVNIPHAMQQPRRRLFNNDFNDDRGETIFGISSDSLDLNGLGNANQGWLAREVNRNIRSGRDMRMMNENMIRGKQFNAESRPEEPTSPDEPQRIPDARQREPTLARPLFQTAIARPARSRHPKPISIARIWYKYVLHLPWRTYL